MNRKKLLICISALALLLAVSFAPLKALALDVGDFNDYDGGGDSGGWAIGWGDEETGGGVAIGGNWKLVGYGVAFFAILFMIGVIKNRRDLRKGGGAMPSVEDHTAEIVPVILESDPLFSNDRFIAWAKEVYFTLSYAWMERDWEKVRPFEKEELYRQHEMQLRQYITGGRINVLERININQAYLQKYVREREYEYLTVFLQVRMIDYIKDEKTGQVLKGSPDVDCHMRYLYTFMRKNGVKTDPASSNRSTTNCPNCAAPTKITSAGKCEYCNSVIVTGDFDWVLSNIDGVKPHTVIDDSGVILRDT